AAGRLCMGGAGTCTGACRGRAAFRLGAGTVATCHPRARGRAGACADPGGASHCFRLVVPRRVLARIGDALRGLRPGQAVTTSSAVHPVCGLCRMAAAVVPGREARATPGVLEEAPGWVACAAGVANRLSATARPDPPGRASIAVDTRASD